MEASPAGWVPASQPRHPAPASPQDEVPSRAGKRRPTHHEPTRACPAAGARKPRHGGESRWGDGAPGRTRTSNPQIRSLSRYLAANRLDLPNVAIAWAMGNCIPPPLALDRLEYSRARVRQESARRAGPDWFHHRERGSYMLCSYNSNILTKPKSPISTGACGASICKKGPPWAAYNSYSRHPA